IEGKIDARAIPGLERRYRYQIRFGQAADEAKTHRITNQYRGHHHGRPKDHAGFLARLAHAAVLRTSASPKKNALPMQPASTATVIAMHQDLGRLTTRTRSHTRSAPYPVAHPATSDSLMLAILDGATRLWEDVLWPTERYMKRDVSHQQESHLDRA